MSADKRPYSFGGSVFNPVIYESDPSSKIVVLIDKVSRVLNARMWNSVKNHNITATQGRILLYVLFSPEDKKNVSSIASDFGVSKPTISRAIDNLVDKGFIEKRVNEKNRRSHILLLTKKGLDLTAKISNFASAVADAISTLSDSDRREILEAFFKLIYILVENKIIDEFSSCLFCRYLVTERKGMWCSKLDIFISSEQIRLDCPYFDSKRETTIRRKRRKKEAQ